MKNGRKRFPEHLLLAQSNEQHIFPSRTGMIAEVLIFTKQDISPDLQDIFCKQPDRKRCKEQKQHLLNHLHRSCIMVAKLSVFSFNHGFVVIFQPLTNGYV
jgi:hypothetical protein